MKRLRQWLLLVVGAVMSASLAHGGELVRGAIVLALGALGAAAISFADRRRARWPLLQKVLGRVLIDERMEPTLDAAEDALSAIALEDKSFGHALSSVNEGVVDLVRRAVGLSAVRAGHEATLSRIFLETQASALELQARTALDQVSRELDQIRGVLGTIGPSVRHLRLLTRAASLDAGQAPAELAERVAMLREALGEELAHA